MPEQTNTSQPTSEYDEEEYELLPHKEIVQLKEELHKMKSFEVEPTRKLTVNLVELNAKIDRLISIFEEANKQIVTEEGGLTFQEKMRPFLEKMNKILEQNSEIAEGIVAVADLIKEFRTDLENKGILVRETSGVQTLPIFPQPPLQTAIPGLPPLPPPPRRKPFSP